MVKAIRTFAKAQVRLGFKGLNDFSHTFSKRRKTPEPRFMRVPPSLDGKACYMHTGVLFNVHCLLKGHGSAA